MSAYLSMRLQCDGLDREGHDHVQNCPEWTDEHTSVEEARNDAKADGWEVAILGNMDFSPHCWETVQQVSYTLGLEEGSYPRHQKGRGSDKGEGHRDADLLLRKANAWDEVHAITYSTLDDHHARESIREILKRSQGESRP